MNWSEIYEGWRNKLFPPKKLQLFIEETANERTEICKICPHISSNKKNTKVRMDEHCSICGCTISAKTRCLSCSCPLPSPIWKAVLSEDKEEAIKLAKNGKEI